MFVTLEKKGPVGVVTMNRPETLNALDRQVLEDLNAVLDQVEADPEILVAIVTGAGRSFVAGADIGQMSNFTAVEGKAFGAYGNGVFLKLENLSKPTIAAVNGFALGAGASCPWPATSASPARRPSSASPRWAWASPPASAAPSAWPGLWACPTPWS